MQREGKNKYVNSDIRAFTLSSASYTISRLQAPVLNTNIAIKIEWKISKKKKTNKKEKNIPGISHL